MKDIRNICKHVKIHGTNQLEADTQRIAEIHRVISDAIEEFGEVDQNFQWSDELYEPRKDVWLNMYGTLLDLEKTLAAYRSTLGIARASLIVPPISQLDGPVPA